MEMGALDWYFAMSEGSIDRACHDWRNLMRVAVGSARAHTGLRPHLLYDGAPSAFTREMEGRGVRVTHRRVSYHGAIAASGLHGPEMVEVAAGAFLRLEIPEVETEAEFVLYTDCDVQFEREVDLSAVRPALFAAAPQSALGSYADLNSGVLVMNVPAMRAELPALRAFIVDNLHLGLDQEIMRVFHRGRYEALDPAYNWKPYWPVNEAAAIVHWHGPKPEEVRKRVADAGYVSPVGGWNDLLGGDAPGYPHWLQRWEAELAEYEAST